MLKIFELSPYAVAKLTKWIHGHKCEYTKHPEKLGAIGGGFTYTFTPTSIGVIVKIKCYCGAGCDLTDYDSW